MPDLPTGTVTFLFTDIEGSTALWEQHRDAMRQALVQHDALVDQVVAEHGGQVVRPRGEGDSRFAVFARATDAVTAAATLQQALHAEAWPTPTPLRVRMALHTGEADLREGDYYGSAVNRCARLRAVAHGGQTLVSLATEQLVRGQLSEGVSLRNLGEHRLKDLQDSERVFQLGINGLPTDFPPLETLNVRPNNLPVQRDSLIGRERDVAAIVDLLGRPNVGLVTLTGPGGIGKTRLALQVAAERVDDFSDGVWFVDLAPLSEPDLALSTIATVLGVKDVGGQPLLNSMTGFMRDKHLLLVVDNIEQIVSAAHVLIDLLSASSHLKVLVTSRVVLRLYGEYEYPVPALGLPDARRLPGLEELAQSPAVALFIQRAQAVKPDFGITSENARAVAEICVRLDGLALAIELAAVRVKLLPPQALLARLDQRLKLLTGGARDRSARQQTLRGAIDWSFQLLDAPEQRLFVRLGVFSGGFTVEAAEAICTVTDDLGIDVLDGLASLLDKSLVQQREGAHGEPRFSMLETIREYALDRLNGDGETLLMRQRHADYYHALVETAALTHRRSDTEAWCERFAADHDNLRAVLVWSKGDEDRHEIGLRVAGGLRWFWFLGGFMTEGRQWLEETLSRATAGVNSRAQALCGVGLLAMGQGDTAVARERLAESIKLWRGLEDTTGLAEALHLLGHVESDTRDYATARRLFTESRTLYQVAGDPHHGLTLLVDLGKVAYFEGDFAAAGAIVEEGLAIYRAQDIKDGLYDTLNLAGDLAQATGDYQRAAEHYTESLAVARDTLGIRHHADMLRRLGSVAWHTGDQARALALYRESLVLYRDSDQSSQIGVILIDLAGIILSSGHAPERAQLVVRLLGAGTGILDSMESSLEPADRTDYERALATTRAQLNEAVFAAAWAEGRAMTLEQAIAYALEEPATYT